MVFDCVVCSEQLADGVHCSECSGELHFHCAGITESGYRKLGDRKLKWRCPKCKQLSSSPRPLTLPQTSSNNTVLEEIKASLALLADLPREVQALRAELSDVKTMVVDTNTAFKEFREKVDQMDLRLSQVEKAQDQIIQLKAQMDKLESENNLRDQWTRMNNVEVKGVTQTNNENLFDIISSLGSKVQYTINKSQINFVTRVPSFDSNQPKPIIVCFNNRYMKEDFVAAARSKFKSTPLTSGDLGLKGNQRIFVNDHLTPRNKDLLSKTKKAAKAANFSYVWVKHAKIFARRNDTSHFISIQTEKDLSKLV